MKSKVQIKKVMTRYKLTEVIPGEAYEVRMNDLYSEEKRDILCLVQVPQMDSASNEKVPVVEYELEYKNLMKGGTKDRASSVSKMTRSADTSNNLKVHALRSYLNDCRPIFQSIFNEIVFNVQKRLKPQSRMQTKET
jgi:hypothetical protein